MTPDYDDGAQTTYTLQSFCCFFVIMFVLCYTDMTKKLELRLLVVIILFKIEFGHARC